MLGIFKQHTRLIPEGDCFLRVFRIRQPTALISRGDVGCEPAAIFISARKREIAQPR